MRSWFETWHRPIAPHMQYFAIAIASALMQTSPTAIDQARLGPIRVAATKVDDRMHWVNYTVRSDLATDVGVTFWSFEIVRSTRTVLKCQVHRSRIFSKPR